MRRYDLSASQVIASVLATVTGALAASYLGVAGTLIGAAVASFAGTTGTAVYRHYLARTEERLRTAATVIVPLTAARAAHAQRVAAARGGAGDPSQAGAVRPAPAQQPPAEPEPAQPEPAQQPPAQPEPAQPEPAQPERAQQPPAAGAFSAAGRFARAHWRPVLALTLAAFVVTIAAVTVAEAVAGRPLDAVLWGRHTAGTTVSDLVNGQTGPASPAPAPSGQPAPQPSQVVPSPGPSSSPASPSPQPTRSVSPSPSAPVSTPPGLAPSG